MGRMYTEKEMDRLMKINLRLIEKFRAQLLEEYGTNINDVMNMFDILYREQCEKHHFCGTSMVLGLKNEMNTAQMRIEV